MRKNHKTPVERFEGTLQATETAGGGTTHLQRYTHTHTRALNHHVLQPPTLHIKHPTLAGWSPGC